MTFGLRNAGQTFQRFIDEVTRGLDFCYAYLDDFLIFSRDEKEHKSHLHQLFKRLQQYGIVINTSKCVFGAKEVKFLGYTISYEGTKPLDTKVEAIKSFPEPKTIKQLRRFLGMINFYRRFIPSAAQIQAPLNNLLTGSVKGSHPVNLRDDTLKAFEAFRGKSIKVTIDRVKPAYVLVDTPETKLQQPKIELDKNIERRTRSGRRVHFPQFYRP
ncbi:unnamed protein product [Euphydryas editha]|uniref:RNA-directed DNA polymerase n=1 Tax=Euphydryas editha TaxID=104508 RepID=A0AAU9UN42_EUPED|nr:unnamed protein product [Euphydryas editha]